MDLFSELSEAVAPLQAFLAKHYNPNTKVLVQLDQVAVMQDEMYMGINVNADSSKITKIETAQCDVKVMLDNMAELLTSSLVINPDKKLAALEELLKSQLN